MDMLNQSNYTRFKPWLVQYEIVPTFHMNSATNQLTPGYELVADISSKYDSVSLYWYVSNPASSILYFTCPCCDMEWYIEELQEL